MAALEVGAIEVNPIALNITGFFAAQEPVFALEFSLAGLFFGEPHVSRMPFFAVLIFPCHGRRLDDANVFIYIPAPVSVYSYS